LKTLKTPETLFFTTSARPRMNTPKNTENTRFHRKIHETPETPDCQAATITNTIVGAM